MKLTIALLNFAMATTNEVPYFLLPKEETYYATLIKANIVAITKTNLFYTQPFQSISCVDSHLVIAATPKETPRSNQRIL